MITDLQKDLRKQQQEFFSNKSESMDDSRPKYGVARKIKELKKEVRYLGGKKATLEKLIDEVMGAQNPNLEQRVYDLRKKLESISFTNKDIKSKMNALLAKIEEKEAQDVIGHIEDLFKSIRDRKKREECIKRLQKID